MKLTEEPKNRDKTKEKKKGREVGGGLRKVSCGDKSILGAASAPAKIRARRLQLIPEK
jgi:hypothetical protein